MFRRYCLLHGLDGIGLTVQQEDKIAAYEASRGAVGQVKRETPTSRAFPLDGGRLGLP